MTTLTEVNIDLAKFNQLSNAMVSAAAYELGVHQIDKWELDVAGKKFEAVVATQGASYYGNQYNVGMYFALANGMDTDKKAVAKEVAEFNAAIEATKNAPGAIKATPGVTSLEGDKATLKLSAENELVLEAAHVMPGYATGGQYQFAATGLKAKLNGNTDWASQI